MHARLHGMKRHVLCERDSREPLEIETSAGTVYAHLAADPGGRGPNEDSAAVVDLEDGRVVLAVADGAGGLSAAAQASRITVEALAERLARLPQGEALRETILTAIDEANRRVLDLDVRAGSTFAAAAIEDGAVRSYQVGDSAILVADAGGGLRHQAVTHSPTGYAVEAGVFDEYEALRHVHRNLLSNMVGLEDLRIEISSRVPLRRGDTVLVASDGLVDNLVTDEVLEILALPDPREALCELTRQTYARMADPTSELPSKPDDLAILLWRAP